MPEQPNPEEVITNDASILSELEIDICQLASYVQVSALAFARVGMADIRSRQKTTDKKTITQEILSCVQFVTDASNMALGALVYLVDQNSLSDLEQLKSALEKFKGIELSDDFEAQMGTFGKTISSMSVSRMNRGQAERLSRN
ncbi:MAG: hypothetical protein J0I12_11310 [Candidatus Eremiobacteraeota bacterium]|nr:hypothetical protein [Candidatus Eremiobacteraeota bacterium]